jgi:hypothetical protein
MKKRLFWGLLGVVIVVMMLWWADRHPSPKGDTAEEKLNEALVKCATERINRDFGGDIAAGVWEAARSCRADAKALLNILNSK